MQNLTWQSVVSYILLGINFVVAGLNAVGGSVPHAALIIFVLTGFAGILHGPAVVASARKIVASKGI